MEPKENNVETKEVTPTIEETKVETKVETEVTPEENPEVKQKAEQLANIKIAIEKETSRLQEIRKNQKKANLGIEIDEEDLPQIDLKDPSSKAWDKRIRESAAPAQKELEKAKEERRLFTLRQFLSDKPALAKNPEKVKAMMETYDLLKTSTELTSEGIMMDLEKAYAAEHYDELISNGQKVRVDAARSDAIFSDPAVSRGSTAYSGEKDVKARVYSEEEKAQLAKWGMTPAEHAAMVSEQQNKG